MKILIGDDHLQTREGVEHIVRNLPDVDLIDEACSGNELLDKVSSNIYDMVILDMSLAGISGFDFLKQMKRTRNKANVLLYSFSPQKEHAMIALRKGAAGYLSNQFVFEELPKAIRQIRKGGRYVSTESA
jgi:two-component system, NarL family, invasion response regulator UvrY